MQYFKNHVNIFFPLLIVSAVSRRFIGELQFLYFLTPVLLMLFIIAGYKKLLKNKQLKELTLMFLLFGFWAMLTFLWSDSPLFSFIRASYFILLVLGGVCSLILWIDTKEFKGNPLSFLLPANILVVVTSLLSIIFVWPSDVWTGGNKHGFMGIFQVQLSLGGALLITSLAPLYNLLKVKFIHYDEMQSIKIQKAKVYNRKFALIATNGILLLLSIFIMILSHSRAALLAFFIVIIFTLIQLIGKNKKITFILILILLPFIILSNTYLKTKIEEYIIKDSGHIFANREILWGPSWDAAKVGGLIGIGFGVSESNIQTNYQIKDNNGNLRREKGSSFLALGEEVGIIGLLLFMLPLFYIAKNYFDSKNVKSLAIIISGAMVFALIIHAQFEAWMVGISEFNLLIFLIIIFLMYHLHFTSYNAQITIH